MVIECFCVACCDNVSQILYLHFHIPGSVCVGIPYQCGYGGKVTHSSCVLPITPVYYLLPQCTTYYPSVLPITPSNVTHRSARQHPSVSVQGKRMNC